MRRNNGDAEAAAKLAEILLEVGAALPEKVRAATPPDDPQRMRGLPAVGGRGSLGGAIRGTRPGDGLDDYEGGSALDPPARHTGSRASTWAMPRRNGQPVPADPGPAEKPQSVGLAFDEPDAALMTRYVAARKLLAGLNELERLDLLDAVLAPRDERLRTPR